MRLINFTIYAILKSMLLMGRVIPKAPVYWIWIRLGRLAYRLAGGRRELMLKNLENALGDTTTPEQREEIARKSMESLFLSLGELMVMDQLYARWQEHFTFEGDEIIEGMMKEGRGFFVFGGHFGGWLCMASVVYRFPDLPGFNMVARPARNPRVQEIMEYCAERLGGRIITTRGTGRTIEEAFENGELIGLYMDQESRKDQGVFVDFFGRPALTHVVPGYLAWKNGIPLIPYWIIRKKPGYFHILFRKPLEYEISDDKDENNRIVTQAIASEVERTIREYPDQWLWAHNRWRRRPDGTKDAAPGKKKKRSRTSARKKGVYLSSIDQARQSGKNGGDDRAEK